MKPKFKSKSLTPDMANPVEIVDPVIVSTPLTTGGVTTPATLYDVNQETTLGGDLTSDSTLIIANAEEGDTGVVVSSDTGVATITPLVSSHTIDYVGDGYTELEISADNLRTKKIGYHMSVLQEAPPFYDVMSYDAGSLAEHCYNNVAAMISGKTPGDATMNLFSVWEKDFDDPDITHNPNLFMDKSVWDISGVAVMHSGEIDSRYPPALVTPRHALVAHHVKTKVGDRFVYKSPVGAYTTVTVEKIVGHGATDLDVLYFDQAITGCKIYKTFQQNDWLTYARSMTEWLDDKVDGISNYYNHCLIPGISFAMHKFGAWAIPTGLGGTYALARYWGATLQATAFTLARESYPHVTDLTNERIPSDGTSHVPYTALGDVNDWIVQNIGGDSASPVFVPVNNELIFVMTRQGGNANADISHLTTFINTTMNDMADAGDPSKGSYALTHPNLSGFNTY